MPNISFDEIRSLEVPTVEWGDRVEELYRLHVRPWHQDACAGQCARSEADARFAALVAAVERALAEGSEVTYSY
jgi:hypothetical protein